MNVVVDAQAWGFEHVPFNAAFVAALAEAYPGEPIHFFGERDHLAQVQRYLASRMDTPQVTWRPLTLPPRFARERERAVPDFRNFSRVLSEARRLGASRVVACYLHATTGVLALKALSLLERRMLVAFVHHGSLVRVLGSRRYHPLLAFGNGRLRQIVLGDSIREEVVAKIPRLRKSLFGIRHPYFFERAVPSDLPAGGPVTFSFLGLVEESKGIAAFVDLAATFCPSLGDKVRFDLIGGKRRGVAADDVGPWVKTYGKDGPIPRELFERQLAETTYAVFPYEPEYYKLVASGSVLDALTAGKPLIVLRNSQFEELFQTMGDIGYLCADVAEMRTTVDAILRDPPRDRYRRQSENILNKRHVFEPAAVGAQLRDVLAIDRPA